MSDVFFVDEGVSLVDEWMSSASSGGGLVGESLDIALPQGPVGQTDRVGLGHTFKKVKRSAQVETSQGALADRLAKKKKQETNSRRNDDGDDDDEGDMHGLVEKGLGDSRSNYSKSEGRAVSQKVVQVKSQRNASLPESNTADSARDIIAGSDGNGGEEGRGGGAEGGERVRPDKRFRKKTRSKQKNIRRDNRPDHERPAHLAVGSKEYAGRPLTAETKAVLGIATSKSRNRAKPA